MKKNITRSLFLLMICIVFFIGITLSKAEIEVDVKTTSSIEQTTTTKRDFKVDHLLDVSYVQTSGEPEIVLALDRSNSMLEEGFDGEPVAKAVWDSVNSFLDVYYAEYTNGNVAIVSFGTNAVKNDNWKYYDNITDAKNEVANIFSYEVAYEEVYEYVWQNNHWQKVLIGRDYVFSWLNWQHENGGTNMKEAFQYAEQTIWQKDKDREPYELMPNTVILFSDGVATHGGDKSEEDLLYPTVHNSNTLAAMDAAEVLDEVANIITVGYFHGIEDPDVRNIAWETLDVTNNGGFYEAPDITQIHDMFQAAHNGIKYVGVNSIVTETVSSNFIVDKTSIEPQEGLRVKKMQDGGTQLTWDLGALKPKPYNFSYNIETKPNVLPTGDPNAQVDFNPSLEYVNLQGESVVVPLTEVFADVGPLEGVPYASLRIEQLGSVDGGYLTGDDIVINHYLAYINTVDYMYTDVLINSFTKSNKTAVSNPFDVSSADWSIVGNKLVYNMDVSLSADENGEFLSWEDVKSISMTTDVPGDYEFDHQMDYIQYDATGNAFNGYFEPLVDTVRVKESAVNITITATGDLPVSGAQIYVDEVLQPGLVTDETGKALITGLKSGDYHIGVKVPSGYKYDGTKNVINGVVQDLVTLNYGQPTENVELTFKHVFVKNVKVAAFDGSDFKAINDHGSQVKSYVEFELSLPYQYVELYLQDTHGIADELEATFVLEYVLDADSNPVMNFTYDDAKKSIVYNQGLSASELPIGVYKAYGYFTIPETVTYPDNLDFINVDDIEVKAIDDEFKTLHKNLYSDGLDIFIDENGPDIVLTGYDSVVGGGEAVEVKVEISDKESKVDKYYVLYGNYETEEAVLAVINNTANTDSRGMYSVVWDDGLQSVTGYFEVQNPQEDTGEGYFDQAGLFTVYAVDEYGNASIVVVPVTVFKTINQNT